jgi:hypothetical protein
MIPSEHMQNRNRNTFATNQRRIKQLLLGFREKLEHVYENELEDEGLQVGERDEDLCAPKFPKRGEIAEPFVEMSLECDNIVESEGGGDEAGEF